MIKDFQLFEKNSEEIVEIESLYKYRTKFNSIEDMLVPLTKLCCGKTAEFKSLGFREIVKIRMNDITPVFEKTFVINNGEIVHQICFVDDKKREYVVVVDKKIVLKSPKREYSEYDPFGEETN